ncbi:MAG: glycosyltransferase family 61 protein [Bauldia sp.]|nr:glycosyltransferase family 61 protein [Bauldia sp.]
MLNPHQVLTLRESAPSDGGFRLDNLHIHKLPVAREFAFDERTIVWEEEGAIEEFRPPSRIFGTPEDSSCLRGTGSGRLAVPSRRIHRVDRARIIGWRTVLDENGRVGGAGLRNGDAFERLGVANRHNHEGFVLTDDGAAFFAGRPDAPRVYDRVALFIPYLEPGNHGAFLIRCLPLFLFLKEAQLPPFDVYVLPERTPAALEAMRLLKLPDRPVYSVREVCGDIFRTIHFVHGEPEEGFFDARTKERLRRLAAGPEDAARPARLYISRALTGPSRPRVRQLVNEGLIETMVTGLGFSIVHPEVHSLHEQMRIFAHARTIVGPSGSGMLNSIFSPPGTTVVDIESFSHTVRQHAKVYASTDKDYAFVFGNFVVPSDAPNWQRPWTASRTLVREAIAWALDLATA